MNSLSTSVLDLPVALQYDSRIRNSVVESRKSIRSGIVMYGFCVYSRQYDTFGSKPQSPALSGIVLVLWSRNDRG